MKALFLGLTASLLSCSLFAQKAPIKFGNVPIEEIKMTAYDKDSSAAAVILADFGESTINYYSEKGFILNFERITRIKILKKDGFDWADFSIPLYHEGSTDEKMSGLKAVTYNLENGKVTESKAKSESVFKEKFNENLDMIKVTLPNVKVGSVLEITYRVNSEFLFNFQDWQFQSTIPVVWSEYRANIPEYFTYDKYMQGYVGLSTNEQTTSNKQITLTSSERSDGKVTQTTFTSDRIDYIENRSRWVAQDVPAFKTEPFMTTFRDYVSEINFELSYIKLPNRPVQTMMGDWADINKRYSENSEFMGEISGNNFLKKIVEELTATLSTEEQKIAALTGYVKNNILWNGQSRKFPDSSLKKVMDEKKGNSAEVNLLLASLLEKAGVQVSPVLVSTRDNGFVRESIPMSSQFNYVICLAISGDKKILLDATDALLPSGVLPERCLNGKGFVISKAGHSWIELKSPVKSKTFVNADFKISADGAMEGKLSMDRTGYHAQVRRKTFLSKGEEEYVKDYTQSWQISKKEFKNTKEVAEAFKEGYELTINDHASATGNLLYLNPFVILREEENPFKSDKREYPVDFGSPMEKTYTFRLSIPEGYTIDEVPQSRAYLLPGNAAKYLYNVANAGAQLVITSSFQINRNIFTQDEYPALREFYNQVIAKQAEQIVLKKK
jgi:hypothetical protein